MRIDGDQNSFAMAFYGPAVPTPRPAANSQSTRITSEENPHLPTDTINLTRNSKAEEGEEKSGEKGPLDKLSPEEQRIVNDLKKRDAEVKAHEQAHIAAGGPYVRGAANYEYERGPDNRNYAVGGEVSIDTSPENTPEATIRKMQIVRRAALAPADPSGQDRSVAAQASQIEAQARQELQKEKQEEKKSEETQDTGTTANASDQPGTITGNQPQAIPPPAGLAAYQQAASQNASNNLQPGNSFSAVA